MRFVDVPMPAASPPTSALVRISSACAGGALSLGREVQIRVLTMSKLNRILAVFDGTDADAMILGKAVALAHQHGAALELFLCDAERAYSLLHAYDPTGIEGVRSDCIRQARRYLECL